MGKEPQQHRTAVHRCAYLAIYFRLYRNMYPAKVSPPPPLPPHMGYTIQHHHPT